VWFDYQKFKTDNYDKQRRYKRTNLLCKLFDLMPNMTYEYLVQFNVLNENTPPTSSVLVDDRNNRWFVEDICKNYFLARSVGLEEFNQPFIMAVLCYYVPENED